MRTGPRRLHVVLVASVFWSSVAVAVLAAIVFGTLSPWFSYQKRDEMFRFLVLRPLSVRDAEAFAGVVFATLVVSGLHLFFLSIPSRFGGRR